MTNAKVRVDLMMFVEHPQHKGDHMLYLTLKKELPRRRTTAQCTQKLSLVPKVITISLLNPPCSYRLKSKKGSSKVVKFFI